MSRLSRRSALAAAAAGVLTAGAIPSHAQADPVGSSSSASPKFKLGMVTYMVAAQWDIATILKVCREVGIAGTELRTTHKHGVEPSLGKSQRHDVRKQFADANVELWGLGTTCEFHSPDPAVVAANIETCKSFIDLCADVGGRGVKVRPNGLPRDVPVEKTLNQIGKALIQCGDAAANAGIEIWVEVHGSGTAEPKNMQAIMKACGHKSVGLTWNSNASDITGGSVKPAFDLLSPWIRSCHINELYKDAAGSYPYRELFSLFRQASYDRYTLIEVGRSFPDVATSVEVLRYYRALWLELAMVPRAAAS